MPSIHTCHFYGDYWGEWQECTTLDELPEAFATDGVSFLLTTRSTHTRCYLYDPDNERISWAAWDGERWSEWVTPLHIPTPPNYSTHHEETYFSVVSHQDDEWLVSINLESLSMYACPIDDALTPEVWDGPSELDPPPNLSESTDVLATNDYATEWVIAVNLEDKSVFFAEWDGEEFSAWEQVASLSLPESWLEWGIDLDGAIVEGQLQLYAIVHDDNEVAHL